MQVMNDSKTRIDNQKKGRKVVGSSRDWYTICKTVQRITSSAIATSTKLDDLEKEFRKVSLSPCTKKERARNGKENVSPQKSFYGLKEEDLENDEPLNANLSTVSSGNQQAQAKSKKYLYELLTNPSRKVPIRKAPAHRPSTPARLLPCSITDERKLEAPQTKFKSRIVSVSSNLASPANGKNLGFDTSSGSLPMTPILKSSAADTSVSYIVNDETVEEETLGESELSPVLTRSSPLKETTIVPSKAPGLPAGPFKEPTPAFSFGSQPKPEVPAFIDKVPSKAPAFSFGASVSISEEKGKDTVAAKAPVFAVPAPPQPKSPKKEPDVKGPVAPAASLSSENTLFSSPAPSKPFSFGAAASSGPPAFSFPAPKDDSENPFLVKKDTKATPLPLFGAMQTNETKSFSFGPASVEPKGFSKTDAQESKKEPFPAPTLPTVESTKPPLVVSAAIAEKKNEPMPSQADVATVSKEEDEEEEQEQEEGLQAEVEEREELLPEDELEGENEQEKPSPDIAEHEISIESHIDGEGTLEAATTEELVNEDLEAEDESVLAKDRLVPPSSGSPDADSEVIESEDDMQKALEDKEEVPVKPVMETVSPKIEAPSFGSTSFFGASKPVNTVNPMFVVPTVSTPPGKSECGMKFISVVTASASAAGTTTTPPSFGGFGSAPTTSAPAFGQSGFGAIPAKPSVFGQPSTPAFGQPVFGHNATSTPQAAPSVFGQTSAPKSVFGQSASGPASFGGASTGTSVFGQPASEASPFGQPAKTSSSFGSFGSSQAPAFGTSSTPAQASPFGQPSVFGSGAKPSAAPGFGSSGFGVPVSSSNSFAALAQTTSPAPAPSSFAAGGTVAFGASSVATSGFGAPAFGQPAFGQPAFGASTATPTSMGPGQALAGNVAFGSRSALGANAPTVGFGQSVPA